MRPLRSPANPGGTEGLGNFLATERCLRWQSRSGRSGVRLALHSILGCGPGIRQTIEERVVFRLACALLKHWCDTWRCRLAGKSLCNGIGTAKKDNLLGAVSTPPMGNPLG